MLVRQYTEADFAQIKELHSASGFDYKLPSFSSKEFFSRRVAGDGKTVGVAAFLRLTAEAYLICNPRWRNPAWRFEALRQLSYECNADARSAGVQEVNAFLPPKMVAGFGRRLDKLGWEKTRNDWRCVFHKVE
jgi:hypothetical protein